MHTKDQLRIVNADIADFLDLEVPCICRKDFWFHAKEVIGGRSIDRDVWPLAERLDFYKKFLGIIHRHRLPIAMGCVFSDIPKRLKHEERPAVVQTKVDHLMAFGLCLERADHLLKYHLYGRENGKVIAEDVPKMKGKISQSFSLFASGQFDPPQDDKRQSREERLLGLKPKQADYHIRCIEEEPRFVAKGGDPILQLADACAYAFRRCLSKQSSGNALIEAMLGGYNAAVFYDNDAMFEICSGALLNVPIETLRSG